MMAAIVIFLGRTLCSAHDRRAEIRTSLPSGRQRQTCYAGAVIRKRYPGLYL